MEKHYLRPIGPLPIATTPDAAPSAIFIGRARHAGFAALEQITRRDGAISRSVILAAEARQDPPLAGLLARLEAPRRDLAGLALDTPRIMGVVNVTPDSFSDGGRFLDPDAAIAHGLKLEEEGAEILDIGGESTRPGAKPLDPEDECARIIPVIRALALRSKARLSVDTRNSRVMQRAVDAGVHILNDVSALAHDPASTAVAAASGLPVVLMHMRGNPETMQAKPAYGDVVLDVTDYLEDRIDACVAAGIARENIIVDPGIGFGKTLSHNLALLRALSILHGLGVPVLLGASRKSFIANLMTKLTGTVPTDRLGGSIAAALEGTAQGAQIIRVHDVAATRQAIAVQRQN